MLEDDGVDDSGTRDQVLRGYFCGGVNPVFVEGLPVASVEEVEEEGEEPVCNDRGCEGEVPVRDALEEVWLVRVVEWGVCRLDGQWVVEEE